MESKNLIWEIYSKSNFFNVYTTREIDDHFRRIDYWLDNIDDDENLIQNIKDKISNEKIEVYSKDLEAIFAMKNMTEPAFFEIFKQSNCKPFCIPRIKFSLNLQRKITLFDIERLTIKDIKKPNSVAVNNIISILDNTRKDIGEHLKDKLRKKIDDILNKNIIPNSILVKWQFFYRYDLAFNFLVSSKSNITNDVIESIRDIINTEDIDISTVINDFMNIESITDIQRRNIRSLLITLGVRQCSSNVFTKEQVEFLVKHVFRYNHLKELLNSNMIKPVSNILLTNSDIMDDIMGSCNTNIKKDIIYAMICNKVITYPQLMEITKKYKIPMSSNTEMVAINTLEGSYIDDFLRCLNRKVINFIKKEMETVDLNVSLSDITVNIDCDCKDEVNLLLDLERYKRKEG